MPVASGRFNTGAKFESDRANFDMLGLRIGHFLQKLCGNYGPYATFCHRT